MIRGITLILSLTLAGGAWASAPDTSPRPVARPAAPATTTEAQTQPAASAAPRVARIRPQARPAAQRTESTARTEPARQPAQHQVANADPQSPQPAQEPRTKAADLDRPGARSKPRSGSESGGLLSSLRPLLRSDKVTNEARALKQARQKGAVCGDVAIQGTPMGRVTGQIGGCVIENAVAVRSVSGIGLTQRATMDCTTAKTLKRWVENGLKPSVGGRGGGVARIKVAAHYACRARNNQRGSKLSEHGKGRAIDISGFLLRDGTEISVLKHWNSKAYSQMMRNMHRTACGPFGTVLGPNANKFHRDHFHFDTARYRSGSYCR
ncbi:extensin family protein [Roseovarius sp. SCSIO 43702]|uniref:extensin-like domain-containing protein n=1 Tax=Roseovarius sp. SCSIO 43702 TaxID=2823043 RepID=UPI001C72B6F5|nr:extensin family protein [Roseovarius sp. SCSIO 43702]QYX56278.1 extensin family protein [Roseovarius sp. SCSIO 43702]